MLMHISTSSTKQWKHLRRLQAWLMTRHKTMQTTVSLLLSSSKQVKFLKAREIIGKLKELGAQGILVTPIEKMIL